MASTPVAAAAYPMAMRKNGSLKRPPIANGLRTTASLFFVLSFGQIRKLWAKPRWYSKPSWLLPFQKDTIVRHWGSDGQGPPKTAHVTRHGPGTTKRLNPRGPRAVWAENFCCCRFTHLTSNSTSYRLLTPRQAGQRSNFVVLLACCFATRVGQSGFLTPRPVPVGNNNKGHLKGEGGTKG